MWTLDANSWDLSEIDLNECEHFLKSKLRMCEWPLIVSTIYRNPQKPHKHFEPSLLNKRYCNKFICYIVYYSFSIYLYLFHIGRVKIKFISPSGHVMLCLLYWNQWNSHGDVINNMFTAVQAVNISFLYPHMWRYNFFVTGEIRVIFI